MNGKYQTRSVVIVSAAIAVALLAAAVLFASGSVLGTVPLVLALTAFAGLIRARRSAGRDGKARR